MCGVIPERQYTRIIHSHKQRWHKEGAKKELFTVLAGSPYYTAAMLLTAIQEGRINSTRYISENRGDVLNLVGCMWGHLALANNSNTPVSFRNEYLRQWQQEDVSSHLESFIVGAVDPGETDVTNEYLAVIVQWLEEYARDAGVSLKLSDYALPGNSAKPPETESQELKPGWFQRFASNFASLRNWWSK